MLSAENVLVFYPLNRPVQVCGPACYNAHRPLCNCVCDGLHHRKGFAAAKTMAADTIQAIAVQRGDPIQIADGFIRVKNHLGDYYALPPL